MILTAEEKVELLELYMSIIEESTCLQFVKYNKKIDNEESYQPEQDWVTTYLDILQLSDDLMEYVRRNGGSQVESMVMGIAGLASCIGYVPEGGPEEMAIKEALKARGQEFSVALSSKLVFRTISTAFIEIEEQHLHEVGDVKANAKIAFLTEEKNRIGRIIENQENEEAFKAVLLSDFRGNTEKGIEEEGRCIIQKLRNCKVFQQCMGKNDEYENDYMGIGLYGARIAGRTAARLGGDYATAYAIYCGFMMAIPSFGQYGFSFLVNKDPEFSLGEYGKAFVQAALDGIESERKSKIYQGLFELLEYGQSDVFEATIAFTTMSIIEKFVMIPDNKTIFVYEVLNRTIDRIRQTGEIEIDESYVYENFIAKLILEGSIVFNKEKSYPASCINELEKDFQYCMENFQEIPHEFYEKLPEMEQKVLVAYYVTTRPEVGIVDFNRNVKSEGHRYKVKSENS